MKYLLLMLSVLAVSCSAIAQEIRIKIEVLIHLEVSVTKPSITKPMEYPPRIHHVSKPFSFRHHIYLHEGIELISFLPYERCWHIQISRKELKMVAGIPPLRISQKKYSLYTVTQKITQEKVFTPSYFYAVPAPSPERSTFQSPEIAKSVSTVHKKVSLKTRKHVVYMKVPSTISMQIQGIYASVFYASPLSGVEPICKTHKPSKEFKLSLLRCISLKEAKTFPFMIERKEHRITSSEPVIGDFLPSSHMFSNLRNMKVHSVTLEPGILKYSAEWGTVAVDGKGIKSFFLNTEHLEISNDLEKGMELKWTIDNVTWKVSFLRSGKSFELSPGLEYTFTLNDWTIHLDFPTSGRFALLKVRNGDFALQFRPFDYLRLKKGQIGFTVKDEQVGLIISHRFGDTIIEHDIDMNGIRNTITLYLDSMTLQIELSFTTRALNIDNWRLRAIW